MTQIINLKNNTDIPTEEYFKDHHTWAKMFCESYRSCDVYPETKNARFFIGAWEDVARFKNQFKKDLE